MKKTFFLLLLFISIPIFGQKYRTRTGVTQFKASVDTFEPIEAKNNSTSAMVNLKTGDFVCLLFVKAFNFRVGLMQEHFNENYMDSDKFPKATFKGNIKNFNFSELSDTQKKYTIKGTLTIRGIKKEIETTARLSKKGNKLMMYASFEVQPKDFKIKIPKIVSYKIAKRINISLDYALIKKK
ncbi:MAG: Uncharacterised protein [Flavobacterium sp. SCGC AAA160-P02]|nr:MAG: Uncharacterised protein [Flavobacterium sp. SCGC AAA160-P02]